MPDHAGLSAQQIMQRGPGKKHPQLLLNLLEAGRGLQHVPLQQVVLQPRQYLLVRHVYQLQYVETFEHELLWRQQLAPHGQRLVETEVRRLIAATPDLADRSEIAFPYAPAMFAFRRTSL